jgi:hypothetical protein
MSLMSELPAKSRQEFVPDPDALQAVERVVHAHLDLQAALVVLRGLAPDSLRAAFVLAQQVSDVGHQFEGTGEISEPNRRTILAAGEDAANAARYQIRRNAAGVSADEEADDMTVESGYEGETAMQARDASWGVSAYAGQFDLSDEARSAYRA